MDKISFRKINRLFYFARIDGAFNSAEVDLLKSMLKGKGLQKSYLNEHKQEVVYLDQLAEVLYKVELLYWILKLIHADDLLHKAELAYSRIIARQPQLQCY